MKLGVGLLAVLALLGMPATVLGEEFVHVTSVTIDPVATLCDGRGCVHVTGTITCDAEGPAELIGMTLTQQRVEGIDDLDLLDFACSTTPRPFTVVEENYVDQLFHPGRATVVAYSHTTVLAEAAVRIRR